MLVNVQLRLHMFECMHVCTYVCMYVCGSVHHDFSKNSQFQLSSYEGDRVDVDTLCTERRGLCRGRRDPAHRRFDDRTIRGIGGIYDHGLKLNGARR